MNTRPAYTDKEESPFTGKERDAETSYYYHGARFNCSDIGWLSVDPMAEKYPEITPYHYCHWNPIKLVDPTGEDDWEVSKDGHIRKLEDQTLSISGKDRLRREGMTNWDNCVVVRQGVITEQELDYKNGVEGSFLLINGSREEAVGIFKYCADNTDVEYSLIELEGINKNEQMQTDIYLTTSHVVYGPTEAGSDDYGSELSKIYAGMLKSHLHSHKRYNVSWHNREDVKFKEAIENRKKDIKDSKPAKFGVYKCKGNERNTTDYAGNKIDPITMERLK